MAQDLIKGLHLYIDIGLEAYCITLQSRVFSCGIPVNRRWALGCCTHNYRGLGASLTPAPSLPPDPGHLLLEESGADVAVLNVREDDIGVSAVDLDVRGNA